MQRDLRFRIWRIEMIARTCWLAMAAKQGLHPTCCGLSQRLYASLPLVPRRPWRWWTEPIQHLLVARGWSLWGCLWIFEQRGQESCRRLGPWGWERRLGWWWVTAEGCWRRVWVLCPWWGPVGWRMFGAGQSRGSYSLCNRKLVSCWELLWHSLLGSLCIVSKGLKLRECQLAYKVFVELPLCLETCIFELSWYSMLMGLSN